MSTRAPSSCPHQFSWEEWDHQTLVVLYRSERRFVVKRYLERVLGNSSQWQHLSQRSFSHVEPIARAYPMTDSEVKTMHQIFSWHFNGTLKFPIIGGLDQLLDWEDVLDFIERVQCFWKNHQHEDVIAVKSPSVVPTIPVGMLVSTGKPKKSSEKKKSSENSDPISMKPSSRPGRSSHLHDENTLSSFCNHWVQINNTCVPYIIRSAHTRLLPFQVLLDCDLLNDDEQRLLRHFTIQATTKDIQLFERIISSTSSMDFTLPRDLLLIDLYQLVFGMSRVVYVKLLPQQRDVNKSFKTVLAQTGGTVQCCSYAIPYLRLNKLSYILLDSVATVLQPPTKLLSILRRRAVPAQSHEIDYLRLVQFYQRKHHQDDDILLLNQTQQQLLISVDEVQKHITDAQLILNASLTDFQRSQHEKMATFIAKHMHQSPIRKATKRKAAPVMIELKNRDLDSQ